MADRWDDERYRGEWERGRRYPGEGPGWERSGERDWGRRGEWGSGEYGRREERGWRGGPGRRESEEDRGFFDRAGDEIRSWFGDDEARRRRMRDEGEYGRAGYRGGYGWPGTRGYGERYPGEERWTGSREERDWARQWGWTDERESPELRRWNRQEGAETRGPLGYGRRGEGGFPPGDVREERWAGSGREAAGAPWRGRQWHGGESPIGAYAGRGPRNYRRSDERIREDICERMQEDGDLDASDLEVQVSNGEVTLTGSVPDRHAKRLAEDIAESASGVRDVHNQVRVASSIGQPLEGEARQPGDERRRAA